MDTLAVYLPRDLVEKIIKPWYLVKQWDAEKVRAAMSKALEDNPEHEEGINGN